MNFKKKQKKVFNILLSLAVVFCCAFSFIGAINVADAENLKTNYDAFSASLQAMVANYEEKSEFFSISRDDCLEENDEIFINTSALKNTTISYEETTTNFVSLTRLGDVSAKVLDSEIVLEKKPKANRLIVKSDKIVKPCGAVASAEYKDYHIFQYENSKDAREAFDYYSNNDEISSVEYDQIVEIDAEVESSASSYYSWGWKASDDFLGANEYIRDMMASFRVPDLNVTVIAVLDSGINSSHALFQGRILHQYAKNFTNETSTTSYAYEDLNGHGTHVSGTIAEITMSNVYILPLKVLKGDGKGWVSWIVDAITYAQKLKSEKNLNIKALNMSIGVDASPSSNNVSSQSASLTNAVKNAYSESGILSVVSAGNDSKNTIYANPANVDCAITVSALKKTDSFSSQKMFFDSNYSNYGEHVDFAAPGSAVLSASRLGYGSDSCMMSGTSMAAPHVTAVVALIYSNPNYMNYSFQELNLMLRQNALDYGDSGWDPYYGYGVINIAKLGLVNNGSVEFSETEQMHTEAFALSFDYSLELEEGQSLKIFYSLDETATTILPEESSTNKLYTGSPITISKTTKVTAVAFVYDGQGSIVKRSHTCSIIYYFNNVDLLSNYTFVQYSNGVAISQYNGELKTLVVPERVNFSGVVRVDAFAFNNSNVEILYLPKTIKTISASAFQGNSVLKEIYCDSTSLIDIGAEAFRWCSALNAFEIYTAKTIGDYAFADCSSLTELYLPYGNSIGEYSLSKSGVSNIMFGPNMTTFGNQTKTSLQNVYGYSQTNADEFAEAYKAEFVDLSLKILQDLPTRKVVKETDSLSLSIAYVGFGTICNGTWSGVVDDQVTYSVRNSGSFESTMDLDIHDLVAGQSYELKLVVEDFFGEQIASETLTVEVVENSRSTYSLDLVAENYRIFIDGEDVSKNLDDVVLYENVSYEIMFEAVEGFYLDSIIIGGREYSEGQKVNVTIQQGLVFEVESSEQENLQINFNCNVGGRVYVNDMVVTSCQVERGTSLTFNVENDVGYGVKSIKIDGEEIVLDEEGCYTLENVKQDRNVVVEFEQRYYTVKISLGKGGTISPAETESAVACGEKKVFKISAEEGYYLDYISVNGVVVVRDINAHGYTFEIEEVNEDCEVYVSLKKEVEIFGSEFSSIIKYFIVFVGIFVVFIVARILIYYSKKEKNKIEINKYKK